MGIRKITAAALLLSTAAFVAGPVYAQSAPALHATFDIPAGDLATALRKFSRQARIEVIFVAADLRGRRTNGVHGALASGEALDRIIAGSGTELVRDPSGAVLVRPFVSTPRRAPVEVPRATAPSEQPAIAAGSDIVVTGSRIVRKEVEGAVPVAVVSAEAIGKTGAGNIQDVLTELPAVGQSVSRATSNISPTGQGQATVNLRNLGTNRTLVLVNGRRFVPGIAGSSAVDLNTIPTDLISRVEVVTGGASAVYGSEAIAGVVNLVLDDKFVGLRARGQATVSSRGDAPRQQASLTYGTSFLGGRGHIVAYGGFDDDHGLSAANRDYSRTDSTRSSFAPQGVFSPNNAFSVGANTFTYGANNVLKTYQGANIDGYNRNSDELLSVPVKRYQAVLLGSVDLGDHFKPFWEAEYTHTKSQSGLEPQSLSSAVLPEGNQPASVSTYLGIPISNPFIPDTIRNAMIAAGTTRLPFRSRSNAIYNRNNLNERNTYRGVIGVRGDIVGDFKYEAYYTHGESDDHTQHATVFGSRVRDALNAVAGPDGPMCIDAAARAAGCIPINVFGRNTYSPAAIAYLTNNGALATYDGKTKQDVAAVNVTGTLAHLPAGPLQVSFGGEHRYEKSSQKFDQATNNGDLLGFQLGNTAGRFSVNEVYGEAVAPLLADKPFVHALNVEAAIRYADYSTVGGVASWKAGAEYAPTSDLRLRGVYAVATRAPNIGELYGALSQTVPVVTDPCDQGRGAGDAANRGNLKALPASCSAIPAIAAAAAAGGFVNSTAQIQSVSGFTGGNPNLKQETARTLTLGAVFTPRFARHLSLTVDYYDIRIANAINTISQQISLDQCYQGSGLAVFCSNIVRDAQGVLKYVNSLQANTAKIHTAGIDTQFHDYVNVLGGRADLTLYWTHLFKQEQTPYPGGPAVSEVGQLDCQSCGRLGTGFRDKVNAALTFSLEHVSLNWQTRYYSPVVDTLDSPSRIRVPAYFYHDAQIRFKVGSTRKLELYVGVNNIFDKQPPIFANTNPVWFSGTNTVASTYDLYGRMVYAGAQVRF